MLDEIFEESKVKPKKKRAVRVVLMHRMCLKSLRNGNLAHLYNRKKKKKLKKFLNIHLENTFSENSENVNSKSHSSIPNLDADEQRGYYFTLTIDHSQDHLHSTTEASLTLQSTQRKAFSHT